MRKMNKVILLVAGAAVAVSSFLTPAHAAFYLEGSGDTIAAFCDGVEPVQKDLETFLPGFDWENSTVQERRDALAGLKCDPATKSDRWSGKGAGYIPPQK